MNKYIITHEKIKMQNREEQDFIVAALYNHDKKMIEVNLTPPDEDSLLGNIYIGRVENVVQNIRAAFVKISPEFSSFSAAFILFVELHIIKLFVSSLPGHQFFMCS